MSTNKDTFQFHANVIKTIKLTWKEFNFKLGLSSNGSKPKLQRVTYSQDKVVFKNNVLSFDKDVEELTAKSSRS